MALYLRPSVLTDDDLVRMSKDNPGYRFERKKDGTLIASPTHTKGGAKSGEAFGQLRDYKKRAGGNVYDSNSGFAIGPRKRTYAPDASWLSQPRIDSLVRAGLAEGFWPISPDVVIEVKSDTDDWRATVKKVGRFITRGCSYGVAINPETREVVARGEAPPGLELDFDAIIDA